VAGGEDEELEVGGEESITSEVVADFLDTGSMIIRLSKRRRSTC
jgi:hypothetical protein